MNLKLTEKQYEAIQATKMCKVVYRDMYKTQHQLGYTSIGDKFGYHINIAKDAPNEKVKDITLMHEAGHVFYSHLEEDFKSELLTVEDILKAYGKSFKDLQRVYGGPMNFFNICMDLEVNSKLLTPANIKYMKKWVELCTPENYGVPVMNRYYEYYDALISKIKDEPKQENKKGEEEEENKEGNREQQEGNSDKESQDNNGKGSGNEKKDPNRKDPNKGNEESEDDSEKEESEDGENDSEENSNEKQGDGEEKEDPNGREKGKESTDNLKSKLQDLAKALKDDEDLPEEIRAALREENYYDGSEKERDANPIDSNENVNYIGDIFSKAMEEAENNGVAAAFTKGASKEGKSELELEIVENTDKNIKNFLRSIIGDNLRINQDAMRHYNRGTRDRSNGILYNSLRRRVQLDKKKMCIIIDVSGSMNTESIIKAISSIKECDYMLDRESKVRTWDTDLVQEFDIAKLPRSVKSGGGTEMCGAIQKAIKEGFTDIVLYSDYEFYNVNSFKNLVEKGNFNFYPILVAMGNVENVEKELGDIIKKNKHLVVDDHNEERKNRYSGW